MLNRQNFLFKWEAEGFIKHLVPPYAKAASVKKDAGGYWINVQWNCGITAALTVNEAIQALNQEGK